MKLIALSLLIIFAGCHAAKKTTISMGRLRGEWVPVQQEIGGKALPAAIFEKEKLTLSDTNYTFIAESVDRGVVKYSGNKMDIYGREGVNSGKHFTAICKLEKGRLFICYNLAGDSYPASFDTKGHPSLFLSIFARARQKR